MQLKSFGNNKDKELLNEKNIYLLIIPIICLVVDISLFVNYKISNKTEVALVTNLFGIITLIIAIGNIITIILAIRSIHKHK